MSWENILKQDRMAKLRKVLETWVEPRNGKEYVEFLLGDTTEETIDDWLKEEIEEMKATMRGFPKGDKYSDGRDATEHRESMEGYIKDLESI